MSELSIKILEALKPWRRAKTWHAALSGGLDSTVLLHLLVQLRRTHTFPPVTAIHVHHGIQIESDAWPAHCQAFCDRLSVPLRVIRVRVGGGKNIELKAREARYQAFSSVTLAHEVLFIGQHRDDQAETLLFRLLRGAGVNGLAAMPRQRRLGEGDLCRPLLDVPRAQLESYAHVNNLSWIEDPSNIEIDFSRNYLRHEVFPLLNWRWPQASANMERSAAHCAEAQGLLNELAQQDLKSANAATEFSWLGLPSLELSPITRLSRTRQRNAMRHWLAGFSRLPDTDHWAGWYALCDAREDAQPVWKLAEGELHRTRGRIWWLSGGWLRPPAAPVVWQQPDQPLILPGNGQLRLLGDIPDGPLQVSYRQHGEVLALAQRGHRDLKRLLNERGVPSFARSRLPLLYANEKLLAVANVHGLDSGPCGRWQLQWLLT